MMGSNLPELVTFDCAQTLIKVDWQVGKFAVECARHAKLDPPDLSGEIYASLFYARRSTFHLLNLTREPVVIKQFWLQLGRDWLVQQQLEPELSEGLLEASEQLAYTIPSRLFELYPDVRPCLARLKALQIKLAVVSNWDISLHRVLKLFDLYDYFDLVIASLEEGVEKPDPKLFQIALNGLGISPAEAFHLGDDLVDDMQGAQATGMRVALIDRQTSHCEPPYISSLDQIEEAFQWNP